MTENIKHLREILEHNDLTSDMTRAEALAVLDLIEADWREAKAEEEAGDRLRRTLADILTATANVLKGPPGELKEHSWHDLPEKAAALATVAKCVADLTYILDQDRFNELYIYPNGGDGNYGLRFIVDAGEGPSCRWCRIGCDIPTLLAELRAWMDKNLPRTTTEAAQ